MAVPADTPVTTPDASTDAVVAAVLHVPPPVASERIIDPVSHTVVDPVIAVGSGLTLTRVVTIQPVPRE